MKPATIGLLLSWILPYLAGAFITLDWGWMDVFDWGRADRALFLILAICFAVIGIAIGKLVEVETRAA